MAEKTGGGFVAWSREIFRAEKLDEIAEAPRANRGDSFFVWLMKPERLPVDEPDGLRVSKSFLTRLFEREDLDQDPVPRRRRP